MAAALGGFWRLRSAHAEGRAWLETFLARTAADEAPSPLRVAALQWAGELAGLQGDPAAVARIAESLALARAAGDTRESRPPSARSRRHASREATSPAAWRPSPRRSRSGETWETRCRRPTC